MAFQYTSSQTEISSMSGQHASDSIMGHKTAKELLFIDLSAARHRQHHCCDDHSGEVDLSLLAQTGTNRHLMIDERRTELAAAHCQDVCKLQVSPHQVTVEKNCQKLLEVDSYGIDVHGLPVKNAGAPINGGDLATKDYVDSQDLVYKMQNYAQIDLHGTYAVSGAFFDIPYNISSILYGSMIGYNPLLSEFTLQPGLYEIRIQTDLVYTPVLLTPVQIAWFNKVTNVSEIDSIHFVTQTNPAASTISQGHHTFFLDVFAATQYSVRILSTAGVVSVSPRQSVDVKLLMLH